MKQSSKRIFYSMIIGILVGVMVIFNVLSVSALSIEEVYTVNPKESNIVVYDANKSSVFRRSESEINSKYNDAQNVAGYSNYNRDNWYTTKSSTQKPYKSGVLKASTLEAMGRMSNFYRYLVGVKNFKYNTKNNSELQDGALVRNFEFNHFLSPSSKPKDMEQKLWDRGAAAAHNIIAMGYTPQGAITGWMNEGYSLSSKKWDTVGHRYAIAGASRAGIEYGYSGNVGIGHNVGNGGYISVGGISDVNGDGVVGYEDDPWNYEKQGGNWAFKDYMSAFPCPGPMPNWVISPYSSSWTAEFDTNVLRIIDTSKVTVTVKNLSTGKSYKCTEANQKGRFSMGNINFVQPSDYNTRSYLYTDAYSVEVTGLKDTKTKKDAKLVYTVSFFAQPTKISLDKTKASIGTIYGGKFVNHVYLSATVEPSYVGVTWKSSNPDIATVDDYGYVMGVNDLGVESPSTVTITAETDDGKKATCIVTVEDPVRAFVRRLYKLALKRNPEKGGLNYWTKRIKNYEESAASAAMGFFYSNEFINSKVSDDDFITRCYGVMMDRKPDAGGKRYWLNKLSNGMSRKYVLKGFIESNEYTQIADSYNINKGTIDLNESRDRNEGITSFVARCYTKALGRNYDVGGLNYWTGMIINSGNVKNAAINVASNGFFHSNEFRNKKLNDTEYVKVLYRTFLGREFDKGGLNYWLKQLKSGKTRDDILNGFANSLEFSKIMASYGIY